MNLASIIPKLTLALALILLFFAGFGFATDAAFITFSSKKEREKNHQLTYKLKLLHTLSRKNLKKEFCDKLRNWMKIIKTKSPPHMFKKILFLWAN